MPDSLGANIIRAPNTTKKFNELLFVFFIGKEGLPVWWLFRIFTSSNPFFTATSARSFQRLMPLKKVLPPCRNCLSEHLKRSTYHVGIWKRAHIAKPVYPEPTHDNGWQCVDGMIEPKWVSGDFIPQQLADVLVEENIAGLTESDESDDEFDDVLYSLIDGEEED